MPKLKRTASKKKKKARMGEEMKKFYHNKLHSGSKKGPIVKEKSQGIAIAMSEAGESKKKAKKKHKKKK